MLTMISVGEGGGEGGGEGSGEGGGEGGGGEGGGCEGGKLGGELGGCWIVITVMCPCLTISGASGSSMHKW
jgi:hypothetical protein